MGGDDSLITVGRILRPHGIQGDVKVVPSAGWQQFSKLRSLCLVMSDGTEKWAKIEQVKVQEHCIILKLSGFDDRNRADTLKGVELRVREQDLPSLPEGHFYIHELVGLTVKTVLGKEIGSIINVIQMPAQDIYIVDSNGKEIMIPAVKQFVKRIDIQERVMWIDPIEGLVDFDED